MNFSEAAADASVIDALRCIEDKLYERGDLITATGDSECQVTIAFMTITFRGEEVAALVIALTGHVEAGGSADWEALSDGVGGELLQARSSLRPDVLAALDDSCGQFVTLNGAVVY